VINLAATLLAKFAVVIVLTLADEAGLVKTTTLSVDARVVAITSSDIFFALSAI
jgi:hypothetical protein